MYALAWWLVVTAVVALVAEWHPHIRVRSVRAAAAFAAVLGVLNVLLGWLLGFLFTVLLFLPALFSFGLAFLLVPLLVNVVLLRLAEALLEEQVRIEGAGARWLLALAIAVANALMRALA